MVKMPTKEDLNQRDPRSVMTIPDFRTNPIPGAIEQLGNAVSGLGAVSAVNQRKAAAEREQADTYGYNTKLLQFEGQWNSYLQEKKKVAEPGAKDFSTSFVGEYDKAAKEFFSKVPENLKPQFDQKLYQLRQNYLEGKGGAQDFEETEGRRYTGDQLTQSQNVLLERQRQNPKAWDQIQKDGDKIIEAAPHFSTIEKDELKKAWRAGRVESWIKENPVDARKLIENSSKPENQSGPAFEGGKVSQSYKQRLAQIESSGNPNAHNASGADGLYQIMPDTAKRYGVTNTRDAAQNDQFIERFTADNAAYLRKRLGREPTPGELYLAHQQGAGGAANLLANPDALATDVVGTKAVQQNGGGPGMTARQFANKWVSKFDGTSGNGADVSVNGFGNVPPQNNGSFQYRELPPELQGIDHDKLMSLIQKQDANYTQTMNDDIASIRSTGVPVVADPGSITGAVDPEKATTYLQQRELAENYHVAVTDMQALPNDQIARRAEQERPAPGVANFADRQKNYEDAVKAGAAILDQRKKDPATYVMGTNPEVRQAWESFDPKNPDTASNAIRTTIHAQESLGIPPSEIIPLPVEQAGQIAAIVNDPDQPVESRINALVSMVSLTNDPVQQRAILGQLEKAGVPAGAEVAIDAFMRGDTGAARRMFEAAVLKEGDIPAKGLALETGFDANLEQAMLGPGTTGEAFYALDYRDPESAKRFARDFALARNAAAITMRTGKFQSEAIAQAMTDIQGNVVRVESRFSDGGGVLGVVPDTVNQDRLKNGMEQAMPQVIDAVKALATIGLPDNASPEQAAIITAGHQFQLMNVIQDGAFRPYGDKWAFYDTHVNAFVPGPDGKALTWSTNDLVRIGGIPRFSPAEIAPDGTLVAPGTTNPGAPDATIKSPLDMGVPN